MSSLCVAVIKVRIGNAAADCIPVD
jgi:hypothetical protein